MSIVFNQLATLGIIILIGVLLAKLDLLNALVRKKLSSTLIHVIAPMYVINAFQIDYNKDLLMDMGIIALVAFFTLSIGLIFGRVVWRKKELQKRQILTHATGFMNCGFIGYPLFGSLYGEIGIMYTSIFVLVFQCFLWTAGVMIFSNKIKSWYTPLMQPGIIGVFIGLALFIFNIKLPSFLYNTFDMVGSMTAPLAMLIIGAFLSESNLLKALKDFPTYITSAFRLMIAPALVLLGLTLFGFSRDSGLIFTFSILIAGTPCATNTVLFATNFNSDATYSASVVAISTVLCGITLPLWIWIIDII